MMLTRTGMSSENDPAGNKYRIDFRRFSNCQILGVSDQILGIGIKKQTHAKTTRLDTLNDSRKIFQQDEISSLHSYFTSSGNGNTDVGLLQSRTVIDSVSCHSDGHTDRLERFDDLKFLLRWSTSKNDLVVLCKKWENDQYNRSSIRDSDVLDSQPRFVSTVPPS